jgi:peptide/nickel transport system substrate-binding protein
MRRKRGILALLAIFGLVLTACSSSSKSTGTGSGTTSGGGTSTTSSGGGSTNPGGNAVRGGTLNMLGTGDVDYMDPNISYYTVGYLNLRMWARQLLSYPAVPGQTTTVMPDLATDIPTTANGGISADGLTYKLTIRNGVMWNTTPPRQVDANDVVRGLDRTCNPSQPFGGLPDFETLIGDMQTYCDAFAKAQPTVAGIKAFLSTSVGGTGSHSISGVTVDPSNPLTVVFTLNRPATYFVNQLAMPAFSPAPVEYLAYLPASAALAQHTISDGPYEVQSYNPTKTIVYMRNPAWNPATDPIRKAYVNQIDVSMTGNQQSIHQQLTTNSPAADMGWNNQVPSAAIPGLLSSKNPNLILGASYGSYPYIVFNEVSPNNGGVLGKTAVRQALEFGINRTNLIQDDSGPVVSPPLTHILPPGIVGSQFFDLYPYNPTKAKDDLKGQIKNLKLLYQSDYDFQVRMFQTLQADLAKIGITVQGVGVPSADFFTKYLEVPSVAHRGVWDMALTGWYPDWYGDGALSFFQPLFSGPPSYPPTGSNFGFYNSATTNQLIQEAQSAKTVQEAATIWAQADRTVMGDAPVFEITTPTFPTYHASQVHNTVFVPALNQIDPTNVWLTGG